MEHEAKLTSRTVLGIDNDNLTTKLLKEICEIKNISALTARSIEEAEKILAEYPELDLIILNLHLENDEHGLPYLQKLKSLNSGHKDIPVIIFTSDSRPEMEQTCRKSGAEGYIIKPPDIDKLIDEIEKVMESKAKM